MRTSMAIVFGLALSLCAPARAAEAPWDEQLHEMMYHIFYISGLNAMNALNLSRDQIRDLKALARKVEQSATKRPAMTHDLCQGLDGVRKAYCDLSQVLLDGKEVPNDLKNRVGQARIKEAQVIRASLIQTPEPGPPANCARCHLSPSQFTASETPGDVEATSVLGKKLMFGGDKKSADMAHAVALLGPKGIQAASKLAPEVDAILNDQQKQIMQDFACCLIPPAELSNPVRAGQADVSENSIELLRRVRKAPESYWPTARTNTINNLKRMFVARTPELTESQIKDIEQKLADLFERVRKMSDAEFEMNKESLAVELKMKRTQDLSNRQQSFKMALFLLMPGTTQVYDALLKRTENR